MSGWRMENVSVLVESREVGSVRMRITFTTIRGEFSMLEPCYYAEVHAPDRDVKWAYRDTLSQAEEFAERAAAEYLRTALQEVER